MRQVEPVDKATGSVSDRILCIDSLRAVAMTMVVAQHCGLLPFGWTGVWLFYVISGFVISRNFIQERFAFGAEPPNHYFSFVVRRIFRIFPPYFAYLALCFVVVGILSFPPQFHELPYLGTFVFNWRMMFNPEPTFAALGHLWTISVEEQFYIFFPIVILLLKREHIVVALAIIVAGAPMVRALISVEMAALGWDPGRIAFSVYASSFGQFDAFAFGALLALFEGDIRRHPRIAARIAWLAIVVGAAYACCYVGINMINGARGLEAIRNVISGILYGEKREVFVYTVMDLCAVAILAGAIAGWKAFRLIEHPALVAVGQASYGGYLIHALILLLIGTAMGGEVPHAPVLYRIPLFVLVWCIAVAISRLSYTTYERRFIRYGHRISQRLLQRTERKQVGVTP
jgi:peptidoglycan/LPS O-acetylase OafA/YrhL